MFLLQILTIISVFSAIEACVSFGSLPKYGSNEKCSSGCWNGRRKRDVTNWVQDVLLKFDIRLTEDLATEIKDFNEREKEQFIQDLGKMNKAVKLEASAILENDGTINNSEEFLRTLSDKISQDFHGRKWFSRLRSIAGDQIAKLLKEMSQPK